MNQVSPVQDTDASACKDNLTHKPTGFRIIGCSLFFSTRQHVLKFHRNSPFYGGYRPYMAVIQYGINYFFFNMHFLKASARNFGGHEK